MVLGIWFFWPRTPQATAPPTEQRVSIVPRQPPPEWRDPKPEPPIIDEVVVEKAEVCEDEENLITVKAHTQGHTDDAYLQYAIDGKLGNPQAIRMRLDEQMLGMPRVITVFGRQNISTTVDFPKYRIKRCPRRPVVIIHVRQVVNSPDEWEFAAEIKPGESPFHPVRYLWDFGDGNRGDTPIPITSHDYGEVKHDSKYGNFLVESRLIGEDGSVAKGRQVLNIVNYTQANLLSKGVLTMRYKYTPRFPVRTPDGLVTQKVKFFHDWNTPIHVDHVFVTRSTTDGEGQKLEYPAKDVLGTDEIPASGIERNFVIDTRQEPKMVMDYFQIYGHVEEGPAEGVFSMMVPAPMPPPPSKENEGKPWQHQVTDPMFKAKILRAQEILGKKQVSTTDLRALELQGKFEGLTPVD
jgi:hypothetical protein